MKDGRRAAPSPVRSKGKKKSPTGEAPTGEDPPPQADMLSRILQVEKKAAEQRSGKAAPQAEQRSRKNVVGNEAAAPPDAINVHDTYVPPEKLHLQSAPAPVPVPVEGPAQAPAEDMPSAASAPASALAPALAVRPDYLAADEPSSVLFVHFIPPPLRENGKRDLPWIVHSSDGSGCREAKHVCIASIEGFETFEGQPPEQVAGRACSCPIANHHLRGFGVVRWEGKQAIIEHGGASRKGGSGPSVNVRAYRDEARRQGAQLSMAKSDVKRLRETIAEQGVKLNEAAARELEESNLAAEVAAAKVSAQRALVGRASSPFLIAAVFCSQSDPREGICARAHARARAHAHAPCIYAGSQGGR